MPNKTDCTGVPVCGYMRTTWLESRTQLYDDRQRGFKGSLSSCTKRPCFHCTNFHRCHSVCWLKVQLTGRHWIKWNHGHSLGNQTLLFSLCGCNGMSRFPYFDLMLVIKTFNLGIPMQMRSILAQIVQYVKLHSKNPGDIVEARSCVDNTVIRDSWARHNW